MNGKVVQTAELAGDYGFTDVSGEVPKGPFSSANAAKQCGEVRSKLLIQYDMGAELADPSATTNPDTAAMFPGA